ncbi:MAG: hypothetical protein GEU71_06915 [Actinobacteria bacterium]|jgi:hypothetical protein|nr:hypothetical protein [Actinomycetota bacterium]
MTDERRAPTRRHSLMGKDLDGNTIVLSFTISHSLYTCPGCRGQIEVGREHTLVRYVEPDGEAWHQHWHRDCARTLEREMKNIQTRPASELQGRRGPKPRRRR